MGSEQLFLVVPTKALGHAHICHGLADDQPNTALILRSGLLAASRRMATSARGHPSRRRASARLPGDEGLLFYSPSFRGVHSAKLNERTRNPEQCMVLDSGSAPKRAHPGMTQTFTSSHDDGLLFCSPSFRGVHSAKLNERTRNPEQRMVLNSGSAPG